MFIQKTIKELKVIFNLQNKILFVEVKLDFNAINNKSLNN